MRFLFVAISAGLFIPLAILAVLTDLTWRRFYVLAVLIILLACVFYLSQTAYAAVVTTWAASTNGLITVSVSAVLAIFVILILHKVLKNQRISSLSWPAAINQFEMQGYGIAYLERRGWAISLEKCFSGINIYRCRKDDYRMFAVFLRQEIQFDRIMRNLERSGLPLLGIIIVSYNQVSVELANIVQAEGPTIINYKEIGRVDEICMAAEQRRLAQRHVKSRH